MRTFTMTNAVVLEILTTVGALAAESGGILGLALNDCKISKFFFDGAAARTSVTYSPSTEILDDVINGWAEEEVCFGGFLHSHPLGCMRPSQADVRYAKTIMNTLKMDELLLPIVQQDGDAALLYPYIAVRQDGAGVRLEEAVFCKEDGRVISGVPLHREEFTAETESEEALFSGIFARNLELARLLRDKTVICVGCGGARAFCESLARCGVGRFVLIDGDHVAASNVSTQGVFFDEINRPKVEVVARALRRINPAVCVTSLCRFLDDDLSDSELEEAVGEALWNRPEDIVICACSDSHAAQARVIRLALKWAVPFLSAGIYRGGVGAELVFTHPAATPQACPRCVLASRFKEVEKRGGEEENVPSDGCPIFVTDRVNAAKVHIALMLLLYNSKHSIGRQLEVLRKRNLLLMSFSEDVDALGLSVFHEVADSVSGWLSGSIQPVETALFIEQEPNRRCPYCGGAGDLRLLRGLNADTRRAWDLSAFLSAVRTDVLPESGEQEVWT